MARYLTGAAWNVSDAANRREHGCVAAGRLDTFIPILFGLQISIIGGIPVLWHDERSASKSALLNPTAFTYRTFIYS